MRVICGKAFAVNSLSICKCWERDTLSCCWHFFISANAIGSLDFRPPANVFMQLNWTINCQLGSMALISTIGFPMLSMSDTDLIWVCGWWWEMVREAGTMTSTRIVSIDKALATMTSLRLFTIFFCSSYSLFYFLFLNSFPFFFISLLLFFFLSEVTFAFSPSPPLPILVLFFLLFFFGPSLLPSLLACFLLPSLHHPFLPNIYSSISSLASSLPYFLSSSVPQFLSSSVPSLLASFLGSVSSPPLALTYCFLFTNRLIRIRTQWLPEYHQSSNNIRLSCHYSAAHLNPSSHQPVKSHPFRHQVQWKSIRPASDHIK